MEPYFDIRRAMAGYSGSSIETVLETIASRYMDANPCHEYTARPFIVNEIKRNRDYRYEADFKEIFPEAPNGSYVYAWGKYWAEADGELKFTLIPRGPVKIWMNNEKIYGTTVESERYDKVPFTFSLPIKTGWNHLVLRFTNTKAGFGAEFGTWLGKLDYYFFRGLERPELSGLLIEGFDHTMPLSAPLETLAPEGSRQPENLVSLCVPLCSWTNAEKSRGVFGRIFNDALPGDTAIARTDIMLPVAANCVLRGFQSGNCRLYAGNRLARSFNDAGNFQFEFELDAGRTGLVLLSACPANPEPWDFSLELSSGDPPLLVHFNNPFFNDGDSGFSWIFAGPFHHAQDPKIPADSGTSPEDEDLVRQAGTGFDRDLLIGPKGEKTFWRLDLPHTWVRIYNENPLYGHWNYPLGVTLYGLIETARFLKNAGSTGSRKALAEAIGSYTESHGSKSLRTLEYAFFDKEHFGGATAVHHLLSSIDSLDDCGSFGSLILELAKDRDIGEYGAAADYIGNHILHKQDRREEGCFWRNDMMHYFHNNTLWADDLYMSVPFLCRYAAYKNDPAVFDTAALQFEGFKKYLYLEDKKLMAHVFDFRRNMNTGIPWGRGNGWTIFSLTELLMALPKDHPRQEFLLDFFNDLAQGYLACQDENGMWHQVLDMPSSYIETSCTAMFICAFSRGIRYKWFRGETSSFRRAAEKAWQALENYSIDKDGNIYGVCRGSEFSFNPRYYAEHLLPRLNDTHGIGIVLLAGVELLKLRKGSFYIN